MIFLGKFTFSETFVSELNFAPQTLAGRGLFKICSKYVQNSGADFHPDWLNSAPVCIEIGSGFGHVSE
jgi:hypothetical protein